MHVNRQPIGSLRATRANRRAAGFTLIELLTVVFIISLLISILIPSINSARRAAKKVTTRQAIKVIEVALEMFKNDNGKDFGQTNGYPPSFSHPPIRGYDFEDHLGEFPFVPFKEVPGPNPTVYGAHWLPAMLMGVDSLGYVKRSSVPSNLRDKPPIWYLPDPLRTGKPLPRQPLYLDPSGTRTVRTGEIPGTPASDVFYPTSQSEHTDKLPVIVDAFDQPILYYAASTYGRPTNMVEKEHDENGDYDGGLQRDGQPYYFHQDNVGFTGTFEEDKLEQGWNFGGVNVKSGEPIHPIADSGAELTTIDSIVGNPIRPRTFARYILDRKMARDGLDATKGVRQSSFTPVNAKTFLLISAGPDGRYGTIDDVSNLPAATEP